MYKVLMYKEKYLARLYEADSFKKRFLGYMFRKRPHHEAIIFSSCSSIHTFFMKFNIDIIFIDKNMKVIKKVENLKKRKVIMPVRDCTAVIEAEAGTFNSVRTGEIIEIVEVEPII